MTLTRRTLVTGGTALALTPLLPGFPATASPSMTLWEDSKDEYLKRVSLYCQSRFNASFVLFQHSSGKRLDQFPFFIYVGSMWSHIGRVTLPQIEFTMDRSAVSQVMEAVDAEVQRWMTHARRHPVNHLWLESLPRFVKHDMLGLVERKAPTESQSLREVQAFLREVPFYTPWTDIA
jgi:hypothetical protein